MPRFLQGPNFSAAKSRALCRRAAADCDYIRSSTAATSASVHRAGTSVCGELCTSLGVPDSSMMPTAFRLSAPCGATSLAPAGDLRVLALAALLVLTAGLTADLTFAPRGRIGAFWVNPGSTHDGRFRFDPGTGTSDPDAACLPEATLPAIAAEFEENSDGESMSSKFPSEWRAGGTVSTWCLRLRPPADEEKAATRRLGIKDDAVLPSNGTNEGSGAHDHML